MQLMGVTEQVNVTAESPIVDVKQSASTNIRASRSTCRRMRATSRRC